MTAPPVAGMVCCKPIQQLHVYFSHRAGRAHAEPMKENKKKNKSNSRWDGPSIFYPVPRVVKPKHKEDHLASLLKFVNGSMAAIAFRSDPQGSCDLAFFVFFLPNLISCRSPPHSLCFNYTDLFFQFLNRPNSFPNGFCLRSFLGLVPPPLTVPYLYITGSLIMLFWSWIECSLFICGYPILYNHHSPVISYFSAHSFSLQSYLLVQGLSRLGYKLHDGWHFAYLNLHGILGAQNGDWQILIWK